MGWNEMTSYYVYASCHVDVEHQKIKLALSENEISANSSGFLSSYHPHGNGHEMGLNFQSDPFDTTTTGGNGKL